jgi:hypothetical protein
MMPPLVLAMLLVLVSAFPVAAQGLMAFPWADCPVVDIENKIQRCVWVVDAIPVFEKRTREIVEGNFLLDFLNPGSTPVTVSWQRRDRLGRFASQDSFVLPPGPLFTGPFVSFFPESRVEGTLVIWSDKPVLMWAWMVDYHIEQRARGPFDRDPHGDAPQSMGSMHVPIIPVDCTLVNGKLPVNFRWVCEAPEGPPPPQ